MSKKLKKHASLRGTNVVSDAATQLTEFRRGQSASVTILTDFAALNRLGCRAHIRSLAMTQSVAFTMAEILLSLTIIGVVAAITLPSLMANINERTWNTQRKALYARMSQAIAMMPNLNGYGEYEGTNTDGVVTATKDTAAEAFLTEGLSKVLKINNICDAEHLADCGVASRYTDLVGSTKNWPKNISSLNSLFVISGVTESGYAYQNPQNNIDTRVAAFETQNGETISLYYNPFCTDKVAGNDWRYSQPGMCANFIYDLNGSKGPNTVGKDIGFITALYVSDKSVVAPMPLATDANNSSAIWGEKSAFCSAQDIESRMPNIDELRAIFYNKDFLGDNFYPVAYASSSIGAPGELWNQNFLVSSSRTVSNTSANFVRCVKR